MTYGEYIQSRRKQDEGPAQVDVVRSPSTSVPEREDAEFMVALRASEKPEFRVGTVGENDTFNTTSTVDSDLQAALDASLRECSVGQSQLS